MAWLRLIRTDNIGPITFYQLVEKFGSAIEALNALPELSKRGGRKKPLTPPSETEIEKEYNAILKAGGQIITVMDASYPLALSAIDDAPPILSALGNVALLNASNIAIVGARNASLNGKKFAQNLARDLGTKGHIIASGLARGIDTAAHEGALESGTIAVMATGLDVTYPPENQDLYNKIKDGGLIITENPMGAKPYAAAFPRRNRIVSGLSKAVIVIEATKKSGSLITARMAGEQGREIFAVPGAPQDPRSAGPNHLIREGATLITCADDVIEGITNFSGSTLREPQKNPVNFATITPLHKDSKTAEKLQEEILSHLSFTSIFVDELVRACHVTISDVQNALLELELAGRIKRAPGNRVCLLENTEDT